MISRHISGAASICTRAKVTGRPVAADRRRIQSTSLWGGGQVFADHAGGGQLIEAVAHFGEGLADAE